MQAKENDQSTGDRREKIAIPNQERAYGASGGAKGDKDDGKSGDEGQRRSKQTTAGGLAFFELLDANAREHRDVAGHQGEDARGKERNDPRKERIEY